MTFQWKQLECYKENGPITGYHYRINYNMSSYIAGNVGVITTRLTVMKINVKHISVAAINEAGIGPHCPPVPVPSHDQGGANSPNDLCTHCVTCNLFPVSSKKNVGKDSVCEINHTLLFSAGMWEKL